MPRFSLQQYSAVFVIVVIALLLTATGVFAWTPPTQDPPDGNVAAPLNTGTTDQIKNAGLSVNAFAAFANAYIQGYVGIGTSLPTVTRLTVSNNSSALPTPPLDNGVLSAVAHFANTNGVSTRVVADSFAPGGFAAGFTMRKANGTAAAPSALMKEDFIGNIAFFGRGTSAYSSAARGNIRLNAAENWTDSAQGTYMMFLTTPNGTTNTREQVRIDPSGNVGIGTAAPAVRLDVAGSVKVGNGGEACSSSMAGTMRYNSATQSMEFCNGSAWKTLATTN